MPTPELTDEELQGLARLDLGSPNVVLPPRIGPFTIAGRLGSGGMGVVLDARAPSGERVALKLIRPTGDAEHAYMLAQRLLRETRILQQLNHPGIVGVRDSGRLGDLVYLAMDFVEGVTLHDVRRMGPITEPGVMLTLAKQLLETLAKLHEAGVIHRDIKPANVLIDQSGRAILTDFGIARFDEDTAITKIGQVLGSPGYIAPEILEGYESSAFADQFALGKLLFEIAALRPPERLPPGTPLIVQFRLRLEADWTRFPQTPPWPALGAVLKRMMATKPADRFEDCARCLDAMMQLEVLEKESRFEDVVSDPHQEAIEEPHHTVFAPANTLNRFVQALALEPKSPWISDDDPPPPMPEIVLRDAVRALDPPPPPPISVDIPIGSPITAPSGSPALVAPPVAGPPPELPPMAKSVPLVIPVDPAAPLSDRRPRNLKLIAAAVVGFALGAVAIPMLVRTSASTRTAERVAADPKSNAVAKAMSDAAREAIAANDYDGAKQVLESCVKVTDAPICHLKLARLLLLTGDDAGRAHLQRYVDTAPDLEPRAKARLTDLLRVDH